jgi:hypothetical protein
VTSHCFAIQPRALGTPYYHIVPCRAQAHRCSSHPLEVCHERRTAKPSAAARNRAAAAGDVRAAAEVARGHPLGKSRSRRRCHWIAQEASLEQRQLCGAQISVRHRDLSRAMGVEGLRFVLETESVIGPPDAEEPLAPNGMLMDPMDGEEKAARTCARSCTGPFFNGLAGSIHWCHGHAELAIWKALWCRIDLFERS